MNYKIVAHQSFVRQMKRLAKKYPSLKADFAELLSQLADNPLLGTDLGNGVHKVRLLIRSKNKGKSGGARVITYNYIVDDSNGFLGLLSIYDKSELENITASQIDLLIRTL